MSEKTLSEGVAGVEMDARVAEIMGAPKARVIREAGVRPGWPELIGWDHEVLPGCRSMVATLTRDTRSMTTYWEPPRYSTDIAAAWRVVEKLRAEHLIVSVNGSDVGGWWVAITPREGLSVETDYTDTAPLAICKAALLATEGAAGPAKGEGT